MKMIRWCTCLRGVLAPAPSLLLPALFFEKKVVGPPPFIFRKKEGEGRASLGPASDFLALVADFLREVLVRGDLRALRAGSLFCFAGETRE